MSYDMTEFNLFRKRFRKFYSEFYTWLLQFLRKEGERFIREVKLRTPVDTGDLRNHWAIDNITRSGNELEIWFINPMKYASFVEYGHAKPYKAGAAEGSADWVDGYFMMTVSLDKIQRTMPSRFDRELRAFLAGLGF